MDLGVAIRRLHARPIAGLAIALLVFALAFLLRYSLGNTVYNVPFITLFPAILISALVGGLWVGIVVAVLSAVAAWFWFLPPSATFAMQWPEGYVTWALFALTCAIQLFVIHALNQTVDKLSVERDRSAALFQELQHRVANNLQFIAAMLRMKRRALERDPSAGERLFESAQNRLDMMARLHRRLYSPESLGQPISEFFRNLCEETLKARGLDYVNCIIETPSVSFDLRQSVVLGLLVNELVTNSAKHAFPNRERGNISIILEPLAGKQFSLTVKDDGRGLPPGLDLANGLSLGLRVMQSLAVQLGGTITWEAQEPRGTVARFVFPMNPSMQLDIGEAGGTESQRGGRS